MASQSVIFPTSTIGSCVWFWSRRLKVRILCRELGFTKFAKALVKLSKTLERYPCTQTRFTIKRRLDSFVVRISAK